MQMNCLAAKAPVALRAILGCALALGPAQLPAQAMGPRSRETISIRVSVMPRFDVRAGPPGSATGPRILRSNAPSLRVQVVSVPAEGMPGPGAAVVPRMLLVIPD